MNHYIVKKSNKLATVFKRYEELDEAVKHCLIYTRANEDKPVEWFVLSTAKLIPDGHVLENPD